MLTPPVVVILWLVVTTTIATPPPGYIKPTSENDKDQPNYRYKYTISSDNGLGQGKVEARSGELASGQYYINGEQSSTDVKYFADEWGYHPLVKYTTTNSHSVANAQLAFGEHSVKALENTTNFEMDNVLQSNSFDSQTIHKTNEHIKLDETTVEPAKTNFHLTHSANNLSDTIIHEGLIIENAGSFGQRIPTTTQSTIFNPNNTYHTTPGLSAYSTQPTSNEVTTISSENVTSNDEISIYNYKTALESVRQYFGLANKEQGIQYKVPSNRQEFVGGRVSQDDAKSYQESLDNSKSELSERLKPQVPPRLSKPIVVAEEPGSTTQRYEYSTTFPCNSVDDDDKTAGLVTPSTIDEASTTTLSTLSSDTAAGGVLLSPKLVSESLGLATSPVILNPIQAGVALVNAGEADLLSSNVQGHSLNTANFKEPTNIVNSDKTIETQNESYAAVKSKFNGYPVEASLTSNVDQNIEIQKSHEIYAHSLPIQEIHYPPEFLSQAVGINQISPEYFHAQVLTDNTVAGDNGKSQSTLQELQANAQGNNLLYQSNSQEKSNINNLINSINAIENNAIQKEKHDEMIKEEDIYSAFGLNKLLQNVLVNVHQTGGNADNIKEEEENTSKDNTISSLQRFLAGERQQHGHSLDTHITSSSSSSSVSPTEIQMKEIPSEIQDATLHYSLSKDLGKNTIYIHGPTEQGLLINIANYASQPSRLYDKEVSQRENSNMEKLHKANAVNIDQDTPPHIYSLYPNGISEIPLLRPYPLAAERIIDNKVHHSIDKLLPQQYYPVHIIQPYPVEKKLSMPTKAPPIELTNYIDNSINLPYGVQYGVSYQQIMHPPSNNVYENNPIDQQIQTNASKQEFQGYNYDKPIITFPNAGRFALAKRYGSLNQLTNNQVLLHKHHQQQSAHSIYPKKIHFTNQLALPLQSRSIDHQITGHRHLLYRTHEKGTNKNEEYIGPVPLPQPALNLHQQNQVLHPLHQETLGSLANAAAAAAAGNFWRTRLPEGHYHARTSNFRQSKMEYGFKPPMVPSVQYDEQTATRVES